MFCSAPLTRFNKRKNQRVGWPAFVCLFVFYFLRRSRTLTFSHQLRMRNRGWRSGRREEKFFFSFSFSFVLYFVVKLLHCYNPLCGALQLLRMPAAIKMSRRRTRIGNVVARLLPAERPGDGPMLTPGCVW